MHGEAESAPIGVILAGGWGRRLGGDKATAVLAGRALISYPLAALSSVLSDVVVQAKPGSALPDLPRHVKVVREPAQPCHPLFGIVYALQIAAGRPVLICAADLPLIDVALISRLVSHPGAGRPATLAASGGRLQPLLGLYRRTAAEPLTRALRADPGQSLRDAVAKLEPERIEVDDPELLFNVNTPEDLKRATFLLQPDR